MAEPPPTVLSWSSRPRIARWAVLIDVAPVLVIGLAALATMRFEARGYLPGTLLLVALPLVARRRWPLAVLVTVVFGVELTATGNGFVPDVAAVGLASFTVGDIVADRPRSAAAVLVIAVLTAAGFLAQGAQSFPAVSLPFLVMVPCWVVGDAARGRRLEARARAEEATRLEHERATQERATIAEERRHVARELHDGVAHAVSVMLIQAGAARQVMRTSPERAEESLLAVEMTGRETMAELRRLLRVLSDEGNAGGLTPQPGVAQLEALVGRVRAAGLPAELEIEGRERSLPASADVAVYRIVQEALTNALRYAQRAPTLVHLSYEPTQLRLEILDDGPAAVSGTSGSSGRGLVGMRERALLVGGRLEAGPRLGGGYAVLAWLPLE